MLDPSALSLLRVFSLLIRALCFSLLVPSLLRLGLRFVLLCVFPVVFGLYFSPFIPSFCFLSPVPSFFTRSCLTIVRHERHCFFKQKQGQKICSPLYNFPLGSALLSWLFLLPGSGSTLLSVFPRFFLVSPLGFFVSSPPVYWVFSVRVLAFLPPFQFYDYSPRAWPISSFYIARECHAVTSK